MEQIFSNLVIAWVLFLSSCFSASLTYISIEKQRKLDVITNNSIIEMKKSGLDDKKIIYKIEDYPKTDFDVSTTALKQLKKENISPEIISLITDKQEKNKLYYVMSIMLIYTVVVYVLFAIINLIMAYIKTINE